MAQGKFKVKAKLPDKAKARGKKGVAATPRKNRPIQSKKAKFEESHKLKKMITKTVNKAAEKDIRNTAYGGEKQLSKAQEAVATYTRNQAGSSKS